MAGRKMRTTSGHSSRKKSTKSRARCAKEIAKTLDYINETRRTTRPRTGTNRRVTGRRAAWSRRLERSRAAVGSTGHHSSRCRRSRGCRHKGGAARALCHPHGIRLATPPPRSLRACPGARGHLPLRAPPEQFVTLACSRRAAPHRSVQNWHAHLGQAVRSGLPAERHRPARPRREGPPLPQARPLAAHLAFWLLLWVVDFACTGNPPWASTIDARGRLPKWKAQQQAQLWERVRVDATCPLCRARRAVCAAGVGS